MAHCYRLFVQHLPTDVADQELFSTLAEKYGEAIVGGTKNAKMEKFQSGINGCYAAVIRSVKVDYRKMMLKGLSFNINKVKGRINMDYGEERSADGSLIEKKGSVFRERFMNRNGLSLKIINVFTKPICEQIFPDYVKLGSSTIRIKKDTKEDAFRLDDIGYGGRIEARRPAGSKFTILEYRSVLDAVQAIRVLNGNCFRNSNGKETVFQVVDRRNQSLEVTYEDKAGLGHNGKVLRDLFRVQEKHGYIPLSMFGSYIVDVDSVSRSRATCRKCSTKYTIVGVDYLLNYIAGECQCSYADFPSREAYYLYDSMDLSLQDEPGFDTPPIGDPDNGRTALRWEREKFTRLAPRYSNIHDGGELLVMLQPLQDLYVDVKYYRQVLLPILQHEKEEIRANYKSQMVVGKLVLIKVLTNHHEVGQLPSSTWAAAIRIVKTPFWTFDKNSIPMVKFQLVDQEEMVHSDESFLYGISDVDQTHSHLLVKIKRLNDNDALKRLSAYCYPIPSSQEFNNICLKLHQLRKEQITSTHVDGLILGMEKSNCYRLDNAVQGPGFLSWFTNDDGITPFSIEEYNVEQKEALEKAYHSSASIVLGPPGTGKTATAALIVAGLLSVEKQMILGFAITNQAADCLAEAVFKLGNEKKLPIKVLRMLSFGKSLRGGYRRDQNTSFDELHTLIKNHKDRFKVEGISLYVERLRNEDYHLIPDNILGLYQNHVKELELRIMKEYNVLVSTLHSLSDGRISSLLERDCPVNTLMIDEAGQVPPHNTIISLTLGIKRLVMLGDYKQLNAVTTCLTAETAGCTTSLMEILIQRESIIPTTMLKEQYRMHEEISRLVSEYQYKGQFRNDEREKTSNPGLDHVLNNVLRVPNGKRLVVYNHTYRDEKVGTSFRNVQEAEDSAELVKKLVANGIGAERISLITMYELQRISVMAELKKRKVSGVTLSNVDSFQGKEADIIIICLTRGQAGGKCDVASSVGFLKEPNRLNVAISRARELMFLMADLENLRLSQESPVVSLVGLLEKHAAIMQFRI